MNALYNRVSFYIIAHADDWQLFMQPNAYNDLVNVCNKSVFIFTTAGDAGNTSTYWRAREEGAKSSVRLCLAPLQSLQESNNVALFETHAIPCWLCNNAACYFMRLPDGGLDGNGFAHYGWQSLPALHTGKINSITSVDRSSTYNGWQNLYETIQAIVSKESAGIANIQINYLNPDTKVNHNDHPDHIASGHAVQAISGLANAEQALFTGYSVQHSKHPLNNHDFFWKVAMLASYEKAVYDGSGYSTLKENITAYMNWCISASSCIIINKKDTIEIPAENLLR